MSKSQYAKHITALSAKIFGEVSTETSKRSMRVVKHYSEQPLSKRFEVTDYYPKYKNLNAFFQRIRFYGLFRDEHLDFNEAMKKKKELRGIKKPKKGEGKRAMKRKK